MLKPLYAIVTRFPKLTIIAVLAITVFFATRLPTLHWETDARVYLPKHHPAIIYDEKVDDLFGVKDAVIIGIVNEKEGIFNPETLARIARVTEKVTALPGVISSRKVDVASLSTATIFAGDETSMGTRNLMPVVPTTPEGIAHLKKEIYDNSDLFVGNIVSQDGTAAMIRAKLKEGIANRYMTYWQIKGIVDAEMGGGQAWGGQGGWSGGGNGQQGDWQKWQQGGNAQSWGQQGNNAGGQAQTQTVKNDDQFYLAGRPVIEVTSGMHALQDMKFMIPLLLMALVVTLFLVFRTFRGVILPIFVMGASIVWTLGAMAVLGYPMYTISSMLPVILVAVGIADSVHLLSHYYDHVFEDPHRSSQTIVREVLSSLSLPLLATSVTTAVGFLSLLTAAMPPFKVFGAFVAVGVGLSWLLTVTFIPAVLTVLKPRVGGYLAKRRSMRVHSEQGAITRGLVAGGRWLDKYRYGVVVALVVLSVASIYGVAKLYVDSSWLSDFKKDSELVKANQMLNKKFAGTIFLNVVIESDEKDILKDPKLLHSIENLQKYVGSLPNVGDSLSVVDYIKSMNKTLHAGDAKFDTIPDTKAQVGEYLFLFSVSGRPEQLDELVDYDYRRTNVTFYVKTDHTKDLQFIINKTKDFSAQEFKPFKVDVNLAGSANNSYVWADLLIDSQVGSILISKLGIFLLATLMFRSLLMGLFVVIPVSLTTLFVGGFAGGMGIPLDVSTALAAGVAIGMGVDYAIHYIAVYRYKRRRAGSSEEANLATLRSVGKSIVASAMVVTAGFMVLFFSEFPPHIKLGYLVAGYMVVSCLMALAVLPILFSYFRPATVTKE